MRSSTICDISIIQNAAVAALASGEKFEQEHAAELSELLGMFESKPFDWLLFSAVPLMQLEERRMEPLYDAYDLKTTHSADEYKRALLGSRNLFLGTRYLEMLKANYTAPEHTISAARMADAVGYANWSAANLQYGKFAGAIAAALGHVPGKLEGVGKPVTPDVAILVSFGGSGTSAADVTWRLLPGLVQALEELKWVRKPPVEGR